MRFNNPHTGQPTMMHQQPQMVPVQQQYPQQQVMQPVMPGQQYHNQQQFIPNQQFVTPQQMLYMQQMQQGMMPPQQFIPNQQGFMAQHGMGAGQQYPQNNQAVLGNARFTAGSEQQQFDGRGETNRYKETPMQQQQQFEMVEQPPVKERVFVVKPTVHKFPGSDEFKLNTCTTGFADANMHYENAYVASDSLRSVAEYLLERINSDEASAASRRIVNVQSLVITNTFYNVEMREVLLGLLENEGKNLLKMARSGENIKVTNRYELAVRDELDRVLTNKINDFLAINFKEEIDIDSFFGDYAELLVAVRASSPKMEDPLIDTLSDYINGMYLVMDNTQATPNATVIPERVTMAVIDKHSLETGLEEAQTYFMEVQDTASNVFLRTLAGSTMTKAETSEFMLMTTDKKIFAFAKSKDSCLYVRKVA